jgi:spore germination cell wall hydrolase CwlJ-like protein
MRFVFSGAALALAAILAFAGPASADRAGPEEAVLQPQIEEAARERRNFWAFLGGRERAPETPQIRLDAAWLAALPPASGDQEWTCLAEALYFEARGESVAGQVAVAEVILNRRDSGAYPGTVCGVVRQRCQFSYTCDGISDRIRERAAYERVGKIARLMLDGAPRALTGGATHFHTGAVRPAWSRRFPQTARIGAHYFYRQPIRG